ncbi:MAG TPA: hypothetical protein DF296_00750 [Candidatus Margulisbacteria bacterium]|nr:MAG: hypothetical protein A2X41_12795 [Candidatus Margulisbacteria bacterium GWE2_39_32]HCT83710.1 hypothetical protein [Candidatus Margulisiibacteriota bacterium]
MNSFKILACHIMKKIIKNQFQINSLIREDLISYTFSGTIISTNIDIIIKQYKTAHIPSEYLDALVDKLDSLKKIVHPYLIKIVDYECINNNLFVIYEHSLGMTLPEAFEKGEFFLNEAPAVTIGEDNSKVIDQDKIVSLLEKINEGLAFLYGNNYCHGAINPDTIFLLQNGAIKITDYVVSNEINMFNLQSQHIIDQAAFYSPEQLTRGITTKSSDIYSLGIILYWLYSGNLPFKNNSDVKKLNKEIFRGAVPPESMAGAIPAHISNVIMAMLERDRKDRFKNIGEVIASVKDNSIIKEDMLNGDEMLKQLKGEYMSEQKGRKKRLSRQKIIIAVIAAGVLIGFAGVYGLYLSYFSSIREVRIPDLRNVYKEEAVVILKSLGLKPEIAGQIDDEAIAANHIVSTVPEIGRIVKEGRIVKLFVSRGASKVSVPNLIGMKEDEAFLMLKEQGFAPKITERIFSNSYPKGTIISQEPSADASLETKSEVGLVLSDGYPVEVKAMDSKEDSSGDKLFAQIKFSILKGWTNTKVKVEITSAGNTESVYDETHAPGDVMLLEFEENRDSKITIYYDGNIAFEGYVKDYYQ